MIFNGAKRERIKRIERMAYAAGKRILFIEKTDNATLEKIERFFGQLSPHRYVTKSVDEQREANKRIFEQDNK
jgi:hypothetical protein